MTDTKRMDRSAFFAHFESQFNLDGAVVRDFFEELLLLSRKELKRTGEFLLPGVCKLAVQHRQARTMRHPATGESIEIPAKTQLKARVAKRIKDAVLR